MTSTAELVGRYAERFNARYVTDHAVASPLGLWLLLAAAAPAVAGPGREALETELGTSADDAAARARELLDQPHPAVHAALAVWARQKLTNDAFPAWAATLSAAVERGDVPTQVAADAWARKHTRDLVNAFPLALDRANIVLASAFVTDVRWHTRFSVAEAGELGGPFARSLERVLRAPQAHRQFVARTTSAGLVGVHVAEAVSGLLVLSVIAAPAVPAAAVHAAAHAVAALLAGGPPDGAHVVSLVDLPLGEGHAWTLVQFELFGSHPPNQYDTFLPAWTASGEFDLHEAPGASGLKEAFARLMVPTAADVFELRQVGKAEFTSERFKAAAVTAAGGALGGRRSLVRRLTLRFNRPYAALAMASKGAIDDDAVALPWEPGLEAALPRHPIGAPVWHGVPVFSAWVAKPTEA